MVCLSLVTPITIKVFEKAMAVKLIEPSVRPKSQQVGKFLNLSKAVTFDAPDKIDEKS